MKNTVKEKREQLGISQTELSNRSGVNRQTIYLIENGSLENIESKTMIKIAMALNCDIGDIFFKENVVFTQQNKLEEGG